jgi:TfuA protein
MAQNIHIFCGTSLDLMSAERLSLDRWTVHGPIKRFDIPKLIKNNTEPGIICIIDGLFFSSESISLMEIRDAIQLGWKILGCSSMGALRAVEARPIGMVGFGKVYRWLSLFQIEDDDEVAQSVCPDTWAPISLAMVDMRAIISKLVREGEISRTLGNRTIHKMKLLFFPDRTLERLNSFLGKQVHLSDFNLPKKEDAKNILGFLDKWRDNE